MATVNSLLELARRQLGVKEDPPGSNKVKYNTWYYGREVSGAAYPWCMVFVQWVFDRASVKLPTRTASCGALMRAAQAAGCWVTKGYRPGDVVIYDFPGGAATDHCGIVEAVDDSRVSAIEGNTSSSNDADGGAVERRTRRLSLIAGAVRPTFDEEVEEMRYNTVAECPDWARETVQKLINKGYLGGDGQSLDLSHDMVRILVIQDRAGSFDQ